jgi:hypothetical protein
LQNGPGMDRLRTAILPFLVAVAATGCAAHLMTPSLVYTTTTTTTVEEHDDEVVVRQPACNSCRRRTYVTPYYYVYPYIYVY